MTGRVHIVRLGVERSAKGWATCRACVGPVLHHWPDAFLGLRPALGYAGVGLTFAWFKSHLVQSWKNRYGADKHLA